MNCDECGADVQLHEIVADAGCPECGNEEGWT